MSSSGDYVFVKHDMSLESSVLVIYFLKIKKLLCWKSWNKPTQHIKKSKKTLWWQRCHVDGAMALSGYVVVKVDCENTECVKSGTKTRRVEEECRDANCKRRSNKVITKWSFIHSGRTMLASIFGTSARQARRKRPGRAGKRDEEQEEEWQR